MISGCCQKKVGESARKTNAGTEGLKNPWVVGISEIEALQ